MKFGLFARPLLSLLFLLLISNGIMGDIMLTEARDSIDKSRLHQAHTLSKRLAEGSLDALATKDYEVARTLAQGNYPHP